MTTQMVSPKLAIFVVYLATGFFVLYGLAFSLLPQFMLDLVTQGALAGPSAAIDFRATYGGMTLAVGFLIWYLHRSNQKEQPL